LAISPELLLGGANIEYQVDLRLGAKADNKRTEQAYEECER
jgi:hypothetical protein